MTLVLYAPVSHSFLPLPGDVPMGRVKLNAKHEYEYLANFKILQNLFKAHKIDKVSGHVVRKNRFLISLFQPIPVERLVKCKMQYVIPSVAQRLGSFC